METKSPQAAPLDRTPRAASKNSRQRTAPATTRQHNATYNHSTRRNQNHSQGPTRRMRQTNLSDDLPLQPITTRDNEKWGNDAMDPPSPGNVRIGFQNVNGIPFMRKGTAFDSTFVSIKKWKVNIFGAAEPNLEWRMPHVLSTVNRSARKVLKHAKLQTTSSSTMFKSTYKPGGILTAIVGGWTGCLVDNGNDTTGLGRWTFARFGGQGRQCLSVFMAYRVCQQSRPGPDTVFQQQYLLLRETSNKIKIDPRQQILTDLAEAIMVQASKGDAIVVGIDANAEISTDKAFASFLHQCDLHDLFQLLPEGDSIPHTYEFSKR